MKHQRTWIGRAAAWAVIALGSSAMAQAALIDVSFYNSGFGGTQPSGSAVLGSAGDQWNWVDAANCPSCPGPIGLVNSSGALSLVSMSFSAQGGVVSLNTGSQPVPELMDNYLFDNTGGSIGVSLAGLTPGGVYRLVLYVASNDASGGDRALSGVVTGLSVTPFAATGDPQAAFIDGSNVVELNVQADLAGGLSILENNPGNASGEVDLNGFQLLSAPEPGAFALCGAGLALCALSRRVRARRRELPPA